MRFDRLKVEFQTDKLACPPAITVTDVHVAEEAVATV